MPKPRKYSIVGCSRGCTLNEYALPGAAAAAVHQWFEEGVPDPVISARLEQSFNYHASYGAIGRHRKGHLIPQDHMLTLQTTMAPGMGQAGGQAGERPRKVGDIELLEQLIAAGAAALEGGHVKVSSEQMLKAMELKYKMTAGAAYDEFFEAIGVTMSGLAAAKLSEGEEAEDGE